MISTLSAINPLFNITKTVKDFVQKKYLKDKDKSVHKNVS